MVFSWTLTVIAFILIFISVDGWVNDPVAENPHPLIGCITTGISRHFFKLRSTTSFNKKKLKFCVDLGLAFIQPFMAAIRPLPSSPKRYLFNWAHFLVGQSAHILASIKI